MQSKETKQKNTSQENEKPKTGIVVDGWCDSDGKGGYKGISINTGFKLFEVKFALCTKSIVEYCAAVHGLMWCKKGMFNHIVYTSSTTILNWINTRGGSNTIDPCSDRAKEYLQRCDLWLMEQKTYNKVELWKI